MVKTIYYNDIKEIKTILSDNFNYTVDIPRNIKTVIDMDCMFILGPFYINNETVIFSPNNI